MARSREYLLAQRRRLYHKHRQAGMHGITLIMDDESYQQLKTLAEREGCSMRKQALIFVEWGLEEEARLNAKK